MEFRVGDVIAPRIMPGAFDQSLLALHAHYPLRTASQRQREIPEPAKQVQNGSGGCHPEHLHGAGDQCLVDLRVDLHEIGWGEFQLQVESRQRVVQGLERYGRIAVERPHRIQPALLQIEADGVRRGEPAELLQIVGGR